ncbi:MAG: thioredoxin family protein [Flavobacteriales bacterium]|jgi:thioredoxin-related protein|nr:thioredoxin family protein [Flavobacteriales bacterium]NCG30970.1 thioredoxin fold domain-containing protein [Bacteroidota bacterium]MBT3963658.1 thioredoxin family protein [Flavobacteriales bacterium]MBT4705805.1 thioredoxin family protein [Flavobacteriales bacterium]MBT4929935.1 thioredoxin family protein [Flavobacteriales bacterium]
MNISKGILLGLVSLFFIQAIPLAEEESVGIEFFQGTWEEALQTAEKGNKMIFLDAYTTWCGPCKLLKRNVFPNERVGKFYNKNFINVKVDMEKGIGRKLSSRYRVTVYPTLLFIDGEGNMIKKAVGYHPAQQLIELGRSVISQKS